MNQDQKVAKVLTESKVYCEHCGDGHGVSFGFSHRDRMLCPNCKHWIYKDKKAEMKYKMKEKGVNINDSKI